MSDCAKHLNAHLASCKARCLGALEPGTFLYRGQELRYEHILPKEQGWLNLLAPYRADIRRYLSARPAITLHRFFHHLNSSQAFALNLFIPYFEKGGAPQLLASMGSAGHLSSWDPERIVDVDEGTNVDVTWESGGVRTYCEVKLSEQEFGSAKDDERHREKRELIYRPSLAGACSPEWRQPEKFFQNYQLFRNVWLVSREPDSNLVFLAPRANTKIWRQLAAFLAILHEPLASRVRAVAIEDVIDSLAAAEDLPPNLRTYAELLREKYILPTLR